MITHRPSPTLQELLKLHSVTKGVSGLCSRQLRAHLDLLASLFRPRRILGDYTEGIGKEPVAESERTWAELQDLYRTVAARPFDLRPKLPTPLESVAAELWIHEWEYSHSIQTEEGWQSIRVTSPLTWVVGYASTYAPGALRKQVLQNTHLNDPDPVRAFVLRACLIYIMFQKFPALANLLISLRYRVEVRTIREFGELPLVTISAPFATVRPSDDLVVKAAGLAGGDQFSEVIDLESVRQLKDPLREEAGKILLQYGETL
ncbi:MAG: hypothetical protein SFV54_04765 [Bryobacteraceae bacterium]|nr:hypothetical protein [Bryobacteraceae bacterium]